jgi:hypothetical protein
MKFTGNAYYKNSANLELFLLPVESGSDSSSSSSEDGDDSSSSEDSNANIDEDGSVIKPETTEWRVGAVCSANAQTAHDLLHWKHALLDWVDTRLHEEGLMTPERLAKRERMKPKKVYKLVDSILSTWDGNGVLNALYQDFKATLETARNKPTTGRGRH